MKRNYLKKSLAILLATAMVAATGCGSSDSSSSSSSSSSPSADNSAASTAETGAEADTSASDDTAAADDLYGDEVSIKVMVWDRGDAAPGTTTEDNALTQWIKEQVKEKFNINVEYVSVPRSGSDDKLNIMMSGGTAPDIVFSYDQTLFYNYASSGALTDLTDIYAQYGGNIAEYCAEAQSGIGDLGDQKFAVMKQRGTANARHVQYIRKDWLDELGMDVPTNKEELEEYLYAVKDAGLGTPWGMSGRGDTEKMYLNYLGSYVDLASDRDAYIYSEAYMAVAPGSKDGLKKLNQYYNDGLITQDFPTDTAEDVYMAEVTNGNVGFVLDDTTHIWDCMAVLNPTIGVKPTFIPVQCFDLPDGSYRTPYEYRYAMFVMVPSTTSEEKAVACMKYLNWMADPEVAIQIRYTPEVTFDDSGVAIEMTTEERAELGYPGTPDDLGIMNLNYSWVNDFDILAQKNVKEQASDWADLEWYQNFYKVCNESKFIFPTYAYISDDEVTYGTDVKSKMIQFVYTMICCPADQFDATYEKAYNDLVSAGLQKILDARAAYYDSVN